MGAVGALTDRRDRPESALRSSLTGLGLLQRPSNGRRERPEGPPERAIIAAPHETPQVTLIRRSSPCVASSGCGDAPQRRSAGNLRVRMLECAVMRIAPISRSPLLQWLSFASVLRAGQRAGLRRPAPAGAGSGQRQRAEGQRRAVLRRRCQPMAIPGSRRRSAGDPAPVNPQLPMSCPMCSALVLFVALGVIWSWRLQRRRQARFRPPATREPVPPRYVWPPANPRASPA